jgi:hypothetical protein
MLILMIVMTMHSARSRRLGVDYSVFRCTCMMSSTSERADFCLHISPGNVRGQKWLFRTVAALPFAHCQLLHTNPHIMSTQPISTPQGITGVRSHRLAGLE